MFKSNITEDREYQNDRHWLPMQVIDLLIAAGDYETAARIESAHELFFLSYSFRIAEQITLVRNRQYPSQKDFETILDSARNEIIFHRNWQEHCIASFSEEDNWNLHTKPLRTALEKTAEAREKLFQEVLNGSDNWLDAHIMVSKQPFK